METDEKREQETLPLRKTGDSFRKIYNYSEMPALQIGLINRISPDGRFPVLPVINLHW
jgi:hypothetical protein